MTHLLTYAWGVIPGLIIAACVVIAVVAYQDRRYLKASRQKRWVRFPPPNEPYWVRGARRREGALARLLRGVGVCELVYAGSVVDLLWYGRWVRR